MRRFLYFLPGATGANPETLAKAGLLDRFAAPGGEFMEHVIAYTDAGPAGSGVFVAAGPNPPQYSPDRQRWIEGPTFWAGIEDVDLPPRPEDLQRVIGRAGCEVQAADGSIWRAPMILRFDETTLRHVPNVPTYFAPVCRDGKFDFDQTVDPKYRGVYDLAGRLFQDFAAETAVSLDRLFRDAVQLLAVNYRIGMEEAGLLGLLDVETADAILRVSFDCPTFQKIAHELLHTGEELHVPVTNEGA